MSDLESKETLFIGGPMNGVVVRVPSRQKEYHGPPSACRTEYPIGFGIKEPDALPTLSYRRKRICYRPAPGSHVVEVDVFVASDLSEREAMELFEERLTLA